MHRATAIVDWWCTPPDQKRSMRQEAERRAKALIRSDAGWSAITKIAGALNSTGTLDYQTCRSLFEESYGFAPPLGSVWREHWPPALKLLKAGRVPKL